MYTDKVIEAEHLDLIHDVAYDFHGRRMATCSSDQTVKIWDLEDGEWKCTASWKTHNGSVWRVAWAHPEFGQLIATCSFDRTAAVWEEMPGESKDGKKSHWIKRCSLVDSRTSVTDVKFAPRHLGLQLATCSQDGYIRIYEAQDIMSLGSWTKHDDVAPSANLSCSCLSWSSSRVHPPMIAVGCYDSNLPNQPASKEAHVILYEYGQGSRKWMKVEAFSTITETVRDVSFAPNLGRNYHTLAVASKHLYIFSIKPIKKDSVAKASLEVKQLVCFEEYTSKVWRVCWNVTGTILASSGEDGCVKLWKANYLSPWKCIATLKGDGMRLSSVDYMNDHGDKRSKSLYPPLSKNQVPWH
ncbi:DgyrCDS6235 [Dimorphilus gyrociliatus]|uniref:DgyrCDS6235 n=1 Tax=Dimorphilus gyrociliatus TaxID=2664684 RepID=A0A7I8VP25_9ANNE|nr:DgyrCDS6235 [Dimorphilus gyrociliatus]